MAAMIDMARGREDNSLMTRRQAAFSGSVEELVAAAAEAGPLWLAATSGRGWPSISGAFMLVNVLLESFSANVDTALYARQDGSGCKIRSNPHLALLP
jgi:hypothetical protein